MTTKKIIELGWLLFIGNNIMQCIRMNTEPTLYSEIEIKVTNRGAILSIIILVVIILGNLMTGFSL